MKHLTQFEGGGFGRSLNALPRRSGRVTGPAPSSISLSRAEVKAARRRLAVAVVRSPAEELTALRSKLEEIELGWPVNALHRSECLKAIGQLALKSMARGGLTP